MVIAKRQELLESEFAKARESSEEARKLKEQYERSLADTKEEQDKILKEAKIQAGLEHDRILADADQKAKQILADAKKSGLAEKEKAIKDAEAEITNLAVTAASRIITQTSGEQQDYAIYEEFLKKAGEKSETDGD